MKQPTQAELSGSRQLLLAWVPWLAALLAVAVTLPALTGGFVWDDRWLIQQSPLHERPELLPQVVFSGHGWGTMERPEGGSAYFRPLSNFLHGVLLIAFGAHPLPFRILATLLHAACTLGLAYLLRSRHPRAAWGALLFAVHPVLADAFGWISATPDLLAAGFLLATLLCLDRDRPRTNLAPVCWLLALLSKESAVTGVLWIPLVLYALPRRRGSGLPRMTLVGLALATTAYLGVRALGPGFRRPLGEAATGIEYDAFPTIGRLFLANLTSLFAPFRLTLNAPRWVTDAGLEWRSIAGLVAGVALTGLSVWIVARRQDARVAACLAFGFLLIVAALLPVSQIIPTNEIYAGRFLYLAIAGLCVGVGLAIAAWPGRFPRWAIGVASFVVLALGVRSGLRAAEWRSDETLFGKEYHRQPTNLQAGFNWAGFLVNAGRIDEARPIVAAVLTRAPSSFKSRYLHGLILLNEEKVAEAETVFRDLADNYRATPTLLSNIASCQMRQGKLEEGLATLDQAAAFLTLPPGTRNNRANALKLLGRNEEARREFERAIADNPGYEPARINLITLLVLDFPDPPAARREAREYLRRFPNSPRVGLVRTLVDTLDARSARGVVSGIPPSPASPR